MSVKCNGPVFNDSIRILEAKDPTHGKGSLIKFKGSVTASVMESTALEDWLSRHLYNRLERWPKELSNALLASQLCLY